MVVSESDKGYAQGHLRDTCALEGDLGDALRNTHTMDSRI